MVEEKINIYQADKFSEQLLHSINKLLVQLSPTIEMLNKNAFNQIITSKNSKLFIAECNNQICGMFTLVVVKIPTVIKTVIEDMVVDINFRGKGIGKILVKEAIKQSKSVGAKFINLTSSPQRQTANGLYQKMGFIQRNTNAYVLEI